ncbi:MAG: hypothetical protein V1728_06630 [Candidatus Micrarchaeota archaeon]
MSNATACARNGLNIRNPAMREAFEKMACADAYIANAKRSGRLSWTETARQYKQVTRDFLADLNRARAGPQTESIAKN